MSQPKWSSSWANITSINRPVNESNPDSSEVRSPTEDRHQENNFLNNDHDWQTVTRKRSYNTVYNVSVHNRFEGLSVAENGETSENEPFELKCDYCDFQFYTKLMLKTHMKIHET